MKNFSWIGLCCILLLMTAQQGLSQQDTRVYQESWESLSTHPVPEWFADAKFGIYAHLGVYCVPAFGTEWYPRLMYQENDAVYRHHVATYGDPSTFGYKDFIPQFKLEKFDPEQWAELYKQAGAKFAGPVAEHHDGFSMWASKVNRWNAKDMGPQRDVVGELVAAIRKRDMKIITSFHHAFNVQGYYTAKPGWDTADPKFEDLYGQFKDPKIAYDRWFIKLQEVIDAYQPDQIWFDGCLGNVPDAYKRKFAAYYYNKQAEWGKDVIITRKGDNLPAGVGVLDIERGRMKDSNPQLWQTDDSTAYNSWSWVQDLKVKPAVELIHELIDIVSKNGILLLNVCPKADGTITDSQQQLLREMGQWLKINGEAIYATRPWLIYGQGPTRMTRGGGFLDTIHYTPQDIRFTRSKDGKILYAICLGWPNSDFTLDSVTVRNAAGARVSLLGSDAKVSYTVNPDKSITIHTPTLDDSKRPCQYAFSFKLEGFDLTANPFGTSQVITLQAEQATLEGEKIAIETRNNQSNIGYWDNPQESVHWLVRIPAAGKYLVRGHFAAASGASQLLLTAQKNQLTISIPASASWEKPMTVDTGSIVFEKPGVYHLILAAADHSAWKAVNIWDIQLAPVIPEN